MSRWALMGDAQMLTREIFMEYGLVILCFAFTWFLMPRILEFIAVRDKHVGWEGLGRWILYLLFYSLLIVILSLAFFVGNPIRILIRFKQEFQDILSLVKRFAAYFVTVLPMPLAILVIFRIAVEDFLFRIRYCRGKDAYVVDPSQYKTPQQFFQELEKRGLYYHEEDKKLLKRLNQKFDRSLESSGDDGAYYMQGTMMPFRQYHDDFYSKNKLISPASETSAPAYLYNGILILDGEDDKLKYAPIARYMMNGCKETENENKPYYQDYYIECKILMIDGHVYAIIGTGESRHVAQSFSEYERPFYVLLSEDDQVTTYFGGKYYPDGSIENGYSRYRHLSMWPNTREDRSIKQKPSRYPVRKVERIDRDTINAVALELSGGILKDSIDSFLGL